MDRWILIRGLVREAAHWGAFLDGFRAAFPRDEVRCLDIPGNGRHHRVPTPPSVPAMVEAIRAEAGPFRGRTWLLALSLGGMVAYEWSRRFPDEITGLVVCNTSFGGYAPFFRRLVPATWPTIVRGAMSRDPRVRERAILAVTSSRTELHDETAERFAEVNRLRPVSPLNAARQILAAARYRPARTPPSQPHLVLCGLGDRLVSPGCSQAIARAWGAPLAAHPTAGHDLTLDAGDWVIEEVRSWRSRCS